MKILQVHNYYREKGGEDRVVEQEFKLLTDHGHSVSRYTKSNNEISGVADKLDLLLRTHYSKPAYEVFLNVLDRVEPDLVHVHNFFPQFSPSIFWAMTEKNIPSLLTLHNYRLIHPNGQLTADGSIDERSVGGSAFRCVWNGVYRNSKVQTAVVAHMIEYHRRRNTWDNKVTRFIALNRFCRDKFIEGGLPEDKLYIKPNFVYDHWRTHNSPLSVKDEGYFLYVGRISREKGVKTLVRAWVESETEVPLIICGEGPLRNRLMDETKGQGSIEWKGLTNRDEIFDYLLQARALVLPSEWYECFPLVLLEAFATGVPVITTNIGSQQAIVNDGVNGLHFEMGSKRDLMQKVKKIKEEPDLAEKLGRNARSTYEKHYTPEKNYHQLMKIYQSAIREHVH